MERDEAVSELGKRLKDPWFRASFARDSSAAMKAASLEADDIGELFGVLSELTAAELRVLATVSQKLQDLGISPPESVDMV